MIAKFFVLFTAAMIVFWGNGLSFAKADELSDLQQILVEKHATWTAGETSLSRLSREERQHLGKGLPPDALDPSQKEPTRFRLIFPTGLTEAMALAYKHNPGLEAERARLRALDEKLPEAQSGWRPSLDGVASAGKSYQNPSDMAGEPRDLTPHGAGVSLSQPLFSGFRTTYGIKAAEAEIMAGRAGLQAAEQQLLFDVGAAYVDVLRARAVVELTRGNEEVLQKQVEATQSRFKVGEVTKTDVSQSSSRRERAVAQRVRAEGDLANKQATYARLVGDMPGSLEPPKLDKAGDILADKDALLRRAELHNPNVIAASFGREVAAAQIEVAKGALLPELNLVGSAGRGWEQNDIVPGRLDSARIMAEVKIPLYRGGADYARTRAAYQNATATRLTFEDVRQKVREAALNAWQAVATARASITSRQAEVASTDMARRGVIEEARVGTRTTLDVLNAEQESLDARVALVEAQRGEAVALLGLMAATGDLTAEAMALPVERYDPAQHAKAVDGKAFGFGETAGAR